MVIFLLFLPIKSSIELTKFWQKTPFSFTKMRFIQDFFCDSIHGLHLCDNFGAFNINIDDFIGKNSKKITKNYPSIFYIKVKTPKIELVISLEPSWILTFGKKRWNHSNKFFEISLIYFFTLDPPIALSCNNPH